VAVGRPARHLAVGLPTVLRSAIARTLDAESLEVVEATGAATGGGGGRCTGAPELTIYNAPDRYETESAVASCRARQTSDWSDGGDPTLQIGGTEYLSGFVPAKWFVVAGGRLFGRISSSSEQRRDDLAPFLDGLPGPTCFTVTLLTPTITRYRYSGASSSWINRPRAERSDLHHLV